MYILLHIPIFDVLNSKILGGKSATLVNSALNCKIFAQFCSILPILDTFRLSKTGLHINYETLFSLGGLLLLSPFIHSYLSREEESLLQEWKWWCFPRAVSSLAAYSLLLNCKWATTTKWDHFQPSILNFEHFEHIFHFPIRYVGDWLTLHHTYNWRKFHFLQFQGKLMPGCLDVGWLDVKQNPTKSRNNACDMWWPILWHNFISLSVLNSVTFRPDFAY